MARRARLGVTVKEFVRLEHVKHKYGLPHQRYLDMRRAQGGLCASCSKPQSAIYDDADSLCVDHSHATGTVRSLLCHRCNLLIGAIESSGRDTVTAALAYLNAHLQRERLG